MSVTIQDLSDELVVRIASVLARRPEYGIAIPSRRWLQRQEEKIKQLPKELLRPSGLKRLAIKIADHIDPNIVDPQAVLCRTHSALNPFLIRRLFIALAYEVTVHTDALRSWEERGSDPELSALVGRLDSIVALWTAPEFFHEIYGAAPFDGHHVFVQSGCEACCLAAVGASGRALADLRATLVNRIEERQGRKRPGKEPRLYRVVEAWIDQLRKRRDDANRSEQCRAWSDALLVDLRMARPHIKAWRAKQKKHRAELQAAKRPVYAELRRTSSGAKIKSLPPSAGSKRRTRNGIPVAVVDSEGAEGQRLAAMSSQRRDSIYRADSLAGYSDVHRRERASRGRTTSAHARPDAPEPARMSGPSDGTPTQSFLHRYEQEIPLDAADDDEDSYENQAETASLDEVEESQSKVQGWFAHHVNLADLQLRQDDDGVSVFSSMVHPAFRPTPAHIATSAIPEPLRINKDKSPTASTAPPHAGRKAGRKAPSEWTDCTVHTVDQMAVHADASDLPPVPRIPSPYRPFRPFTQNTAERRPYSVHSASTSTPTSQTARTVVSGFGSSRQTSTTTFPRYEDPFVGGRERESSLSSPTAKATERRTSKSEEKEHRDPLNWPAPPHGRIPRSQAQSQAQESELCLPRSDVGSVMSEQRHAFLVERFKPKGERPKLEPERSGRGRASSSVYSRRSSGIGNTSATTTATADTPGGLERTPPQTQTRTHTRHPNAPAPAPAHAPARSTHPPSSVTQFGDFQDKM